ncbi:hypothetical protein [Cryptosporangium phraense]|uniref:Uncharacterized protein n=1 Tax=Cryptosporangium phraense TaxID=2593070 RepID=A0A545AFZ1_9ACTN|nr:hypothetical protein [Cryptosporangium phraense]TQS40180.1 hypothetical protein FL583_36265 [Cryptosporangium phraense]
MTTPGTIDDVATPIRVLARRSGEPWTDAEYAAVVAELATGTPVDQIAKELQRTPGAVRGALRLLTPPSLALRGPAAESWLREQLAATPAYDWRASRRAHSNGTYWTPSADAILIEAWRRGTPLGELAATVGATELHTHRRLVQLHLSHSVLDTVDRLGCTPGGDLEARYLVARDEYRSAVWVLTINGLLDQYGTVVDHISVHSSRGAAAMTLERLTSTHRATAVTRRLSVPPASWRLVGRGLDAAAYGLGHPDTAGEIPSHRAA